MNTMRRLFLLGFLLSLGALAAFAADPTGKWQWTQQNRSGPQPVQATFKFADGKLTGTVTGRMGEVALGDASFQDDHLAFTITREVNGEKIVIKYQGKLAGDTITGTVERPGVDGDAALILDWNARREP
jgi:hypothetical protein